MFAGFLWFDGFLEFFFVGLLALLVVLVGLFALYVFIQLFRNPARAARRS